MSANDLHGEIDSLFGSPPHSPIALRPASPGLALPSSSCTWSVPENVGTIALPGSHNSAEHNASLSDDERYRQFFDFQNKRACPVDNSLSSSIGNDERRASSAGAHDRVKRPPRKKAKSTSATPAPDGPALDLPADGEPLPPNLLRNQQALLGLAGVVGGVNPAQLGKQQDQGTSAQNPIVVEDQPHSAYRSTWKSWQPPGSLPPQADLSSGISSLLATGDILPLMRTLQPYIGKVAKKKSDKRNVYERGVTEAHLYAPPPKKRKTDTIPAGASNWNIPHPSPDGVASQLNLQNWEKDRMKTLMTELTGLIQNSIRTAVATEVSKPVSGKGKKKSNKPPKPKDRAEWQGQSQSTSPPCTNEQLIFPPQMSGSDSFHRSSLEAPNTGLEDIFASLQTALSENNSQPMENSMADIFSPTFPYNPPSTSSSVLFDTPIDSNATQNALDEGSSTSDPFAFSWDNFNFDDIPIDPALFGEGASLDANFQQNAVPAPAPTPSTGYTPISNDFFGGATDQRSDVFPAQLIIDAITGSMNQALVSADDTRATDEVPLSSRSPSRSTSPHPAATPTNASPTESAQIDDIPSVPPPASVVPAEQQDVPQDSVRNIVFLDPYTETNAPKKGRGLKAKKKEVVRRARERREEIVAELGRAKMELWETTVEQAVLIQLAKDKDFLG